MILETETVEKKPLNVSVPYFIIRNKTDIFIITVTYSIDVNLKFKLFRVRVIKGDSQAS